MATIKAYTDLEQSRELANILPHESADMFYTSLNRDYPWVWIDRHLMEVDDIPCWSLSALLKIMPFWYDIHPTKNGVAITCDYGKEEIVISDNPVDACYEMVLKLHELNLL